MDASKVNDSTNGTDDTRQRDRNVRARPLGADAAAPRRLLYHQILEDLRRQIHQGELKPGDALPPEGALMRRFGVARGTARQAVGALRADGTVAGPRGRPPVVCDRRLAQSFTNLLSFSAWVRSLGMEPAGRLVDLTMQPADDDIAGMLTVALGSPVYRLVRVRYANGEPLLIERTALPRPVGALVAQLDLARDSIYGELLNHGVVFASAHQTIDVIQADIEDAGLLGAAVGVPLLRVRRQAFAPSGQPLEWSDDRYLATRVIFTLDNTATHAGFSRHLAGAVAC